MDKQDGNFNIINYLRRNSYLVRLSRFMKYSCIDSSSWNKTKLMWTESNSSAPCDRTLQSKNWAISHFPIKQFDKRGMLTRPLVFTMRRTHTWNRIERYNRPTIYGLRLTQEIVGCCDGMNVSRQMKIELKAKYIIVKLTAFISSS